jgi:acetamidase/formamidase
MASHELKPTIDHVRWGVFDASIAPVLTLRSGDTVTIETVSGAAEVMPPAESGFTVSPYLKDIHASVPRRGAHVITGPVAVADAEPGDMLEVRIDAILPNADWGYCGMRPLMGTLPEDFPETYIAHLRIDRARGVCTTPWGTELPLAPFFGVMGVAPPPAYGALNTKEPREHGGNLDNKELVAGSTLFLPVWVPGANFSVGDGHGLQGDGEVCVMALETGLRGTFTLILHKKPRGGAPLLSFPRAETPQHYISMGLSEDLDQAMKQALREMIGFITARSNLSARDAYMLCSLAADFHVTQTVNGEKGIHGMLRKELLR